MSISSEWQGNLCWAENILFGNSTYGSINLKAEETVIKHESCPTCCATTHKGIQDDSTAAQAGCFNAINGKIQWKGRAVRSHVGSLEQLPNRSNRRLCSKRMPLVLCNDIDALVAAMWPTTQTLWQRSRLLPYDLSSEQKSHIGQRENYPIGNSKKVAIL